MIYLSFNMENYFCFYNAGLSGTWLAWFVNQHSNFAQFEYEELDTDGIITDLCCDGATWCFMKDPEDDAGDEPMTFDEYVIEWSDEYSTNLNATKRCVKVLPDHDLSQDFSKDMHDVVLDKVDKIIMPVMSPNSDMVECYANRLVLMWEQDYNKYMDIISDLYKMYHGNLYDWYDKPIHFVQIDKLLKCDENVYNSLCQFIDEEPLPNWKELVTDYKNKFIEKFRTV